MTNLDYSDYVGRIAVGKIVNGSLIDGSRISLLKKGKEHSKAGLTVVYTYQGLQKVEVDRLEAGDIAAVAGVEDAYIGDTLADPEDPRPLPAISVEEPTMSMDFAVNSSPMAGQEGTQLNSRQIRARLEKEVLYNVAIRVEPGQTADAFKVSARGELQLAVLVETMRREGFELSLSKPKIITKETGRQGDRAFGACGGGRAGRVRGRGYGKALDPPGQDDQDAEQTAWAGCGWNSRSPPGGSSATVPSSSPTPGVRAS